LIAARAKAIVCTKQTKKTITRWIKTKHLFDTIMQQKNRKTLNQRLDSAFFTVSQLL
jgi:hypothetical protein